MPRTWTRLSTTLLPYKSFVYGHLSFEHRCLELRFEPRPCGRITKQWDRSTLARSSSVKLIHKVGSLHAVRQDVTRASNHYHRGRSTTRCAISVPRSTRAALTRPGRTTDERIRLRLSEKAPRIRRSSPSAFYYVEMTTSTETSSSPGFMQSFLIVDHTPLDFL